MSKLLAEALIRDVPDFPKPGIVFKDITPVCRMPPRSKKWSTHLADWARERNRRCDPGNRGAGFHLWDSGCHRTWPRLRAAAETGQTARQSRSPKSMHWNTERTRWRCTADSLKPGQRVIIIDDLLATGGTAAAAARLVERLGGVVAGFGFLAELDFLEGRKVLSAYEINSLVRYS